MSPKQAKKTLWVECDRCSCAITSNDRIIHGQLNCKKEQLRCPYITDDTLFTVLERREAAVTEAPRDAVLLHPSAAELLGAVIGAPLVLALEGAPPLVRRLWPSRLSALGAVILPTKNLDSSWTCSKNTEVSVSLLPKPHREASEIIISPSCDRFNDSDVLKQHFNSQYVHRENTLVYWFYGKKLEFKIVDLKSDFDVEQENCRVSWYVLSDDTKWTIQTKATQKVKKKSINLGGLSDVLEEIKSLTSIAFSDMPYDDFQCTRGLLIFGHSGTGKTTLCKYLIENLSCHCVEINGPAIFSKFFGETESTLKSLFTDATQREPCIILVDEIDTICPKRSSSSTEQERRVTSAFVSLLDSLHEHSNKVFVLATTRNPDSIDPVLRRFGRLDKEIEMPVPDKNRRRDILQCLLRDIITGLSTADIDSISDLAHGYVGADLVNLCTQASMHFLKRQNSAESLITKEDLIWGLSVVRPSAMRELLVEVPNVKWDDIGGQADLKMKLKQAVEWPLKHAESFRRLGIRPPGGVLMYGPPGCSKTMIAKALATESGLNFLSIKGPELFSKWVGESERAVRDLFRKARQVAPAIIFFDEMDAIGGERGAGEAGVHERVLAQLLTELDGVVPLGAVTVLAATNRPDRMDRALIRPGRLDRLVYVPLPDFETRVQILQIKLKVMSTAQDVNAHDLAGLTEGFSGAELHAVCHEAALKALEADLSCPEVEKIHFDSVLADFQPRTPASLIQIYEKFSHGDKSL